TMSNSTELQNDSEYLTTSIGKLWAAGVEIDWSGYYEGEKRRRIGLPAYPFERQRYWIEARGGGEDKRKSSLSVEQAVSLPDDLQAGHEAPQVEAGADVPGTIEVLYSRPELSNAYVAPSTEGEKIIAGIWQSVLGLDRVGIKDNFFELGGDSLIAIQVISRL